MPFDPDMDVLIVDDASAMRRILRGLLKELGFKNMRDAENGQLALDELIKKKADLVVSDWNMPVMTGIELLRAIRADDRLKSTPVLMVTTEAKQGNIVAAVQAGVSNYIVKPFNARILLARVMSALDIGALIARDATVRPYNDGHLVVDLVARQLSVDGEPVLLTPTE